MIPRMQEGRIDELRTKVDEERAPGCSLRAYYRQDGTYVQPQHRRNPGCDFFDKCGFLGNSPLITGRITLGAAQPYLGHTKMVLIGGL
jgi:hypothetical protein